MKKFLSTLLGLILLISFAQAQDGNHSKIKVNKTYMNSVRTFNKYVNTWDYKSELVQDFFTFFENRVSDDPNVDYFTLDSLLALSNFPVFLSKEEANLDSDPGKEIILLIGDRLSPCKLMAIVDMIGGEYYIVYYEAICNDTEEPRIKLHEGGSDNLAFSVTSDFRSGDEGGISKKGEEFYKIVNGTVYPALKLSTVAYNYNTTNLGGGTQASIESSTANELVVLYDYGYTTYYDVDEITILKGMVKVKYIWSDEEMCFVPLVGAGMTEEKLFIYNNLPDEDYCMDEVCEHLGKDIKNYSKSGSLTSLDKKGIQQFLGKYCNK